MSFWVLDLEAGPPRVRGALSRWAVEVRAGLYVGTTSAKTRDAIWKMVDHEIARETRAILVYPSSSRPMGFEVKSIGPGRRLMTDVDGLLLARFTPVDHQPERLPATADLGDDAGHEDDDGIPPP